MPFQIINQEVADEVARMTLSGELDASSAAAFMDELKKTFQHKPKQLVLFVAELSFIASAGIRALVFAMQGNRGLDVYVIGPQEEVADTIQRSGLGKTLIIQEVYQPK